MCAYTVTGIGKQATTMTASLTPKQKVLQRYSNAYSYRWDGPQPWTIYAGDAANQYLNFGAATVQGAWAQAAERLAQSETNAAEPRKNRSK